MSGERRRREVATLEDLEVVGDPAHIDFPMGAIGAVSLPPCHQADIFKNAPSGPGALLLCSAANCDA